MDKNKKNKNRFSDAELDLMKNTFAEKDDLLILLRKVFLQVKLTEAEMTLIKKVFNKNVIKLVRKAYLPEVEIDTYINYVTDLWLTVDFKDKSEEEVNKLIATRSQLIKFLEAGLERLANPSNKELIGYLEKFDPENCSYIELFARNTLIVHQEQQLSMINLLAGMKSETTEQTVERLKRDSSK